MPAQIFYHILSPIVSHISHNFPVLTKSTLKAACSIFFAKTCSNFFFFKKNVPVTNILVFATVPYCSSCLSLDPYLGCGWCTTTESCLARSKMRLSSNEIHLQGSMPWWLARERRPLPVRSLLHLHPAHHRPRCHTHHPHPSIPHFLHK